MCKQTIISFLSSNSTFFITKVLKQRWTRDRYSYRTNPRPDYGLMMPLHGEAKLLAPNIQLTAKAGDIIFLPKHSHYDAIFESKTENYLINFDVANENLYLPAPARLLQNAPLSCFKNFHSLIEEQFSGNRSSIKLKGLFYLLLDNIVTAFFLESSLENETIEKAKLLLKGKDDLKIWEIARKCGISESGLRKNFKAAVGLSPAKYRLTFKLTQAQYLLESTDLHVSEIADALHFYDTACFCRIFKTYIGMTPMQFAKRKQL